MEKFELHILGCGSALPTTRHFPTSQILNVRDKLFMIDCGEGAQLQFRKSRLKFSRLNHIFISHLHGDHCFGLLGLISTLNLLGRTAELHIQSPQGLEELMKPMLDFFNRQMTYAVVFHAFDTREPSVVYEDRSLTVNTVPLVHRLPCVGFVFREKPKPRHINPDAIQRWQVPTCYRNNIKAGDDYVTPDGIVVPNDALTTDPDPARVYAYISDTMPLKAVVSEVAGADLLYHEATFLSDLRQRAKQTLHTVAADAAAIARDAKVKQLVIGHFSSRYINESMLLDEAKAVFPDTILAKEGLTINI